jgi:Phage integrase family
VRSLVGFDAVAQREVGARVVGVGAVEGLAELGDGGGVAWREQCARAEVPQVRVHELRHSCATLLFTMGVPPATVQRIVRHSSITVTTGTYVEVIEAVQRDALDSMGALFEHVGDESSGRLSALTRQKCARSGGSLPH